MNYEEKRKIADKCDHKFDRYQTMMNCIHIEERGNSDILYHVHRIAELLCISMGSARNYDEIFSYLVENTARVVSLYDTKEG